MAQARINTVVAALLWIVSFAHAQTTILFQGFEAPAPCGTWGYTGGVVNPEIARTGANSNRVGRNVQSNTITFNTVNVAGLAGLQLRLWHAVRPGAGLGPGMDIREGALTQVSLNGGAWTTIGQVGGFNDQGYTWANSPGGFTGTGCTDYQMPNPLVYNVPGGTTTLAFRVLSVVGGSCATFDANMAAGTAGNYDRNDEGFFIDDVTLTTTSPAPYPFIWTGALDTDWHKCQNWNFGVVPNATSNVTIDQGALNNCEVYTAAATCASLSISSNSATARNLTIRAAQSLDVQGPVTVSKTGVVGAAVGITIGDATTNGTLQATSLTMTGTGAAALNAFVRNERPLSIFRINGAVTINTGGYLDLQGGATGGVLQIQGNYTNNDNEAAFDEQFSLVTFWGGSPQSINTAGFQERFGAIRMSKTAGDLLLNAPISLRTATALQFAGASPLGGATLGGRIMSSLPNGLLSLESTVSFTTGATDNSHVDGPIQKFGTVNFIFPIGKSNRWRPVQLQNIVGVATDAFIAEYFPISGYTLSSVMEPTLDHISDCEYWTINRSAGSANARVALSYHNTYSCGVTVPADLRVAKLDEAPAPDIWRDRGNNGVTVTGWGGYVPTTAVETEFGYWTLASISTENPLPVELVSFTAEAQRQEVLCKWITASEWNNDHFTVERSVDGLMFEPVGVVSSLGDNWDLRAYSFPDKAPLPGISYYRLRQTDLDGTSVLSLMVMVHFSGVAGVRVILLGDELELWHDLPAGASWSIMDVSGRLLAQGTLTERMTRLPVAHIRGVFLVNVTDSDRSVTLRTYR